MSKQASEELFLYDDFFSPVDDPGIEIHAMIRGRKVPLRIKRGLSLIDAANARERASTRVLNRQTGMPEVVAMDESRMNILLLQSSIISWPFKYRDGSLVPITEQTIGEMLGDAAAAVLEHVQRLMEGRQEALVPFDKPSVAD